MTTRDGAVFLAAATGVYRTTDHGDNWTRMSWSLFCVNSIVATSGSSPQLYAGQDWDDGVDKKRRRRQHVGQCRPAWRGASVGRQRQHRLCRQQPRRVPQHGGRPVGRNEHQDAMGDHRPGRGYEQSAGRVYGHPERAVDDRVWRNGVVSRQPLRDSAYIAAIAVSPADPSTVFVSSSDGNTVSHDAGQSWSPMGLSRDAQTTAFAFDPADGASVYAGTIANWDAFLATLSPDGTALEFATYIGGRGRRRRLTASPWTQAEAPISLVRPFRRISLP